MNPVLFAILAVSIIGVICALLLSVASKVMAVKEDERFPAVRECLPGANCGACGYAGCDAYAKALLDGERTNLCIPGGDSVSLKLSEVLGTEFEDVKELVAVMKCQGTCDATSNKMDYEGIESCAAAKLLFGGAGKCIYGCMGFGDCAKACPNDAIFIKDGIAHIVGELCVGCGICVETCPNNVIELCSDQKKVFVSCNNTDKGALTRKACSNGCIGCRKCEKVCPNDAIKVENNLARIDFSKCIDCGECVAVCPTGAVHLRYPGSGEWESGEYPTPKI